MMRYLFVGIPSLLFEPVAVCTLLGIIFSFLVFRKKQTLFFRVIIACILFMLGWRLLCHSLMRSTRYASILLYPSAIFTSWFCFHLRDIAQGLIDRFPRLNTQWTRRICAVLPWLFIAGLAIAGTAKTLHYNPYGDHTVKLCRILSEEIKGKKFRLYAQVEHERIAYYTGLEVKEIHVIGNATMPAIDNLLKNKTISFKNSFEQLYFIFYQKKEMPEPDQKNLEIPVEAGKWECLHREYTSRRKNKELVLYRFTPAHPDIEIWEKEIPEMSSKNLCPNGGFEKFMTGKDLEKRYAYYREIGASGFYLNPDRLLPTGWWLGVGKAVNGKSCEMAMTAINPIAGKYSLETGTNHLSWGMNSTHTPKQDCSVSGFIRSESDSTVRVNSCYYDIAQKKRVYMKTFIFYLPAGKLYRFSYPVRLADIPEENKNMYIIIQGIGHVLLDNIEFIPAPKPNTIEIGSRN